MMNMSLVNSIPAQPFVRQAAQRAQPLFYGRYCFDLRAMALTIDGELVEMTQKEFDLALFLFTNLGKALPRNEIFETVWGRELGFKSRTLDTHIARIRRRLGLTPKNGFRLNSIYSFGYRLDALWD
jgi:DNA-binding response OmpR family regulator